MFKPVGHGVDITASGTLNRRSLIKGDSDTSTGSLSRSDGSRREVTIETIDPDSDSVLKNEKVISDSIYTVVIVNDSDQGEEEQIGGSDEDEFAYRDITTEEREESSTFLPTPHDMQLPSPPILDTDLPPPNREELNDESVDVEKHYNETSQRRNTVSNNKFPPAKEIAKAMVPSGNTIKSTILKTAFVVGGLMVILGAICLAGTLAPGANPLLTTVANTTSQAAQALNMTSMGLCEFLLITGGTLFIIACIGMAVRANNKRILRKEVSHLLHKAQQAGLLTSENANALSAIAHYSGATRKALVQAKRELTEILEAHALKKDISELKSALLGMGMSPTTHHYLQSGNDLQNLNLETLQAYKATLRKKYVAQIIRLYGKNPEALLNKRVSEASFEEVRDILRQVEKEVYAYHNRQLAEALVDAALEEAGHNPAGYNSLKDKMLALLEVDENSPHYDSKNKMSEKALFEVLTERDVFKNIEEVDAEDLRAPTPFPSKETQAAIAALNHDGSLVQDWYDGQTEARFDLGFTPNQNLQIPVLNKIGLNNLPASAEGSPNTARDSSDNESFLDDLQQQSSSAGEQHSTISINDRPIRNIEGIDIYLNMEKADVWYESDGSIHLASGKYLAAVNAMERTLGKKRTTINEYENMEDIAECEQRYGDLAGELFAKNNANKPVFGMIVNEEEQSDDDYAMTPPSSTLVSRYPTNPNIQKDDKGCIKADTFDEIEANTKFFTDMRSMEKELYGKVHVKGSDDELINTDSYDNWLGYYKHLTEEIAKKDAAAKNGDCLRRSREHVSVSNDVVKVNSTPIPKVEIFKLKGEKGAIKGNVVGFLHYLNLMEVKLSWHRSEVSDVQNYSLEDNLKYYQHLKKQVVQDQRASDEGSFSSSSSDESASGRKVTNDTSLFEEEEDSEGVDEIIPGVPSSFEQCYFTENEDTNFLYDDDIETYRAHITAMRQDLGLPEFSQEDVRALGTFEGCQKLYDEYVQELKKPEATDGIVLTQDEPLNINTTSSVPEVDLTGGGPSSAPPPPVKRSKPSPVNTDDEEDSFFGPVPSDIEPLLSVDNIEELKDLYIVNEKGKRDWKEKLFKRQLRAMNEYLDIDEDVDALWRAHTFINPLKKLFNERLAQVKEKAQRDQAKAASEVGSEEEVSDSDSEGLGTLFGRSSDDSTS